MKTFVLCGDSKPFGHVIRRNGTLLSASDVPLTDPLYGFRSWAEIANNLFRENNVAAQLAWAASFMGTNFADIEALAQQSWVDGIILSDAGEVLSPSTYETAWADGIAAAYPKPVYCCTTYNTSAAPSNARYNVIVHNGKTLNDMIRDAASSAGATVIPFDTALTAFQTYVTGQTLSVIQDADGIHDRPWAAVREVGAILSVLNLQGLCPAHRGLTKIVTDNWQDVLLEAGAPSGYWPNSGFAQAFLHNGIKALQ